MPEALAITRADHTASELREVATRSNDADATRRMLALALVLEGYKRGEAGKLCGMDRQTLRDWVIRYNAEGIAGLCNRIAAGPKPRLNPDQEAAVAELAFGGCRCGRDIRDRTRRRRRHTKKLCRSGQSRHPRACARKTDRTLVAG